eukprot:13368438-Heterocapsa_arctica.AAC.1
MATPGGGSWVCKQCIYCIQKLSDVAKEKEKSVPGISVLVHGSSSASTVVDMNRHWASSTAST